MIVSYYNVEAVLKLQMDTVHRLTTVKRYSGSSYNGQKIQWIVLQRSKDTVGRLTTVKRYSGLSYNGQKIIIFIFTQTAFHGFFEENDIVRKSKILRLAKELMELFD